MSRTFDVRRSLAATAALMLATVGATAMPAAADPGNGEGKGKGKGQSQSDRSHKHKAHKHQGNEGEQGKAHQGPKNHGNGGNQGNGGSKQNGGEHHPAGNNGTVKIDGVAFDDAPNNEPHVGCVFQVDFYGFDEGELFADVTFEAHPPTTSPSGDDVLLTDSVDIGEDDASGGGSEAGLDASRTYTLDFGDLEPHARQGFHVRLTVHADGSQGADTKHKVFWVEPCGSSPAAAPSDDETDDETESDLDASSTDLGTDDTEVMGEQATADQDASSTVQGIDDAEVMGAQASAADEGDVPSAAAAGEGGNPVLDLVRSPLPLLVVGLGVLLAGAAFAGRRRSSANL